jgi:hypothetical protein
VLIDETFRTPEAGVPAQKCPGVFSNPAINVYSRDVVRLDFLSDLRLAWVADPDGNPIQLAQKRKPDGNR